MTTNLKKIFNKDLAEIKKRQSAMNNTITEIKNTLYVTNTNITKAEEWISELEERMVEIIETEQNRERKMKRNQDSLRDLSNNIEHTNI